MAREPMKVATAPPEEAPALTSIEDPSGLRISASSWRLRIRPSPSDRTVSAPRSFLMDLRKLVNWSSTALTRAPEM